MHWPFLLSCFPYLLSLGSPSSVCLIAGWQAYVDSVTSRVTAELGVDTATVVEAELYKLLLYQEGDHFVPHRDTEKTDGMFATMTILLPSQHMVSFLYIVER